MKKLLCFAIILCSIIAHSSFAQVPPPFVVPALNNLPANAAGYLQNNGTGILSWGTSTGGVAWGAITGTLSSQSDLNTALGLKAPSASPTFTGTVSGVTAAMVGAQPSNANLSTYAGIAPSANVQTLLGEANYAAFVAALSLTPGTNVQAYSANLGAIAAGTWAGAGSITTVGMLSGGSIPYSLLTGTPTVGTLGALAYGGGTVGEICTLSSAGTLSCSTAASGSCTGNLCSVTASANAVSLLGDTYAQMLSAIGAAPLNSPTFTGSPTVPGYLTTSAAASTYSPLAGSSSITTVGTLSAGSIPYSLLTGTPTVGTLGALLAGTMTNGDYCTYATGGTIACNSAGGGSMTWPAAAGIAVYAGSSAWGSSIAESDSYVVYGSGGAWGKSNAPAISAANMTSFPPATLGTGTSVTLTAPREYYVCTGACSVTLPATTAAGNEFCVMNDDNVATVITLTPPTGTYMENQARSAYCTVGHALASGGAVADKICVVGRDSTHYLTIATGGVVTCQ